jgi:hypothetical protein
VKDSEIYHTMRVTLIKTERVLIFRQCAAELSLRRSDAGGKRTAATPPACTSFYPVPRRTPTQRT